MKIIAKIFTVALLLVATFVAQAQTTWLVTNAGDNGTSGTLRTIIANANSGDIIRFSSSVPTITLNSKIVINKPLTIDGSKLIGTTNITLAAGVVDDAFVYTFAGTGVLTLRRLTVGGSVYSFYTTNTNANLTFDLCTFEKYVYLHKVGKVSVSNCNFTSTGNGLYLETLTPLDNDNSYIITNSNFTNNFGDGNSLILRSISSGSLPIAIKVTNCKFYNNRTGTGAMYLFLSSATHLYVNACSFDDNVTSFDGNATAINSGGFSPKITVSNSFFRGNRKDTPTANQGLLMNFGSATEVNLYQNVITGNNGAIIRSNGTITLVQNTIANNNGAVLTANNLQIGNSILSDVSYNIANSSFSFGGNYIGYTTTWANSNDITTSSALTFVSPVTTIPSSGGNYRLQLGSSCLGTGINANLPQDLFDMDNDANITEAIPFDIVGNNRVTRHSISSPLRVDIGAYERQANGGGLRAENTEETLTNNPQTVVYPNPANEVLNINYELSTGAEKAEVAIFNTIGQVVYQTTVSADNKAMKIDVRNFDKGLYVIKIVDNQGNAQNQKVLVQ